MARRWIRALALAPGLLPLAVRAQTRHPAPGQEGTPNVHVTAHVPLGGDLHVTDIEIEQELSRPFVYVSRGVSRPAGSRNEYLPRS